MWFACFVINFSLFGVWLRGQAFFTGVRSGENSSFRSSRLPESVRGGYGVSRGCGGNMRGKRRVDALPVLGTGKHC
jgi:hypothetical protein